MDFNQITKAFLNMREARAKLRKDYDEQDGVLKESQRKLENLMLDHLNASGMESVRTEAGTFYKQESLKPSGSDWEAFYRWIVENDAWEFLERRIKSASIKEHMEMHDGALPPGVSVHREYQVRVRKSS